MPRAKTEVDDFVQQIPPVVDVRRRLSENLREGRLLRQLLRIAEQREKVEAIKDEEGAP